MLEVHTEDVDEQGAPDGADPTPSAVRNPWKRITNVALVITALGGVALGMWASPRVPTGTPIPDATTPMEVVLRVQETGSAFTAALAALTRLDKSGATAIGREVAFSTLSGAVQEAAQLSAAAEVHQLVTSAGLLRLRATASTADVRRQ